MPARSPFQPASLGPLLAGLLLLTGAAGTHAAGAATARRPLPPVPQPITLEWDDLLPDAELGRDPEEPAPRHDYLGEGGPAAQQQGSAAVRGELDQRAVKLPGFVVPLTTSPDGLIREAFLVPYFGACIHVPPPPPNQIVMLRSTAGLRLKSLYDPVWVSGTLHTQSRATRLGTASYTLQVRRLDPYP